MDKDLEVKNKYIIEIGNQKPGSGIKLSLPSSADNGFFSIDLSADVNISIFLSFSYQGKGTSSE